MACRKRRKWSDEEKLSICHQTRAPGVSVSQVARRYAMSGNQIFNWLKDPRFGPDVCHDEGGDTGFIQVEVEARPASILLPTVVAPAADAGSRPAQNGRLEIIFGNPGEPEVQDLHTCCSPGGIDGTYYCTDYSFRNSFTGIANAYFVSRRHYW